ncbi:MAG: hypothetical protein ACLPSF_02275 [Methylocella sp.]
MTEAFLLRRARPLKWIVRLFIGLALFILLALVGGLLLIGSLFPGGCDHGMFEDRRASNGRGDTVGEYIDVCTGFGTVADYSIVLQPQGENRDITLLRHENTRDGFPKIRWIDDNTVSVDLGEVDWVSWWPRRSFGDIRINYTYRLRSWADTLRSWRAALRDLW